MGRTLSEEAVQEAVVHAKAQEFVEEEGRGYENLIYIRGANLSGGQKTADIDSAGTSGETGYFSAG